MPIDLSGLSNEALQQMYAAQQNIHQLESNGAPDTSTITSPKGAQGSMQVMPGTQGSPGFGVTPSNGTTQDTAREGRDYLAALTLKYQNPLYAAMAYNWGPGNMDKWIQSGADMSKVPDETLKYAYNHMQAPGGGSQMPGQTPSSGTGAPMGFDQPQDLSKLTDDDLKALHAQQQSGGLWNNIKGAGMQLANLGAGALEALPIGGAAAIGLGQRLIGGEDVGQALHETVEKAGQNFQTFSPENALNKLGVDTSGIDQTLAYKAPNAAINFAFNTVPGVLGEGMARTGELEAGMAPSEYKPEEGQKAKELLQGMMIMSPLAELHLPGRASDVSPDLQQKLATGDWDQPGTNTVNDRVGPQQPGNEFALTNQPNAGPQRPAMTVDSSGVVRNPLEDAGTAAFNEGVQEHINQVKAQSNDLAMAEPNTGPQLPGGMRPNEGPQIEPDLLAQRTTDFIKAVQQGQEFTQGDLFNETNQRRFDQYMDENPRALSQDEFTKTMEALSSNVDEQGRPRTGFDLPDDPEAAYNKYLETVSDQQGGLFDRPTIAAKFADAANREATMRFVENHPIVKAAQNKVDAAQLALDNARDGQTRMAAAGDLKRAQDTLQKAATNISKFFQGNKDPRFGAYEKDGVIHMNSGIPIPDWMKKGLVNILKALHGVATDFIDRKFQSLKNIKSTSQLIAQGLRQSVNDANAKAVDTRVNEKPVNFIKKAPGLNASDRIKEWVPDERPYEEVKPEFQNATDMDSNWFTKNISAQGGVWASAMSKNPAVKWAVTHVQNALKQADFQSRRLLTNHQDGLRTMAQGLNSRELGEIYTRMDLDEGQRERSPSELKQMGFSDKQIAFHQRYREVMNEVYNALNDGLKRAGLPPVDKRLAYMTSRFMGDFRSMVYQKGTKRPVGFVGAHNRWEVDGIKAKLEEQFPGKYDFEDTTLNKGPQGHTSPNMFQGYLNVLNHFQLNDPEMKAIMDTYRDYFTGNAAKAMGMLRHTKDKTGIMGAEGRKLWQSQEKNAQEGMKSQLTYADHALRWSSLQEAASNVKQLMEDPDVNMPNAKSYIKDYMSQAMGQTTSKLAEGLSSLLDGVAERTGVGPSVLRKLNSGQKSALLQLWLGFLRLPHAALTMTQFLQSNPAMAELVRSRGAGNFWGNLGKGASTALNMGIKQLVPSHELTGFDKDIWDYQQKNQVFSANLTSHLTDINSTKVGRMFRGMMEANITYPEALLRSSTFSIWAHTLKESGMSTKEALGTAENLTRAALVDYRPSERPLVYGKMGMMGDIASTLTRFKMNQISQHQYFGKEAIKGRNVTPMAALVLSSIAFAGMSGLMGFNYADQAYNQITTHVFGKPDTLKALMLRNLPDWANYGMLSQLGINMQGSFSNADTIPNDPWSVMFPTGSTLVDMAKSVGQAAYYHDATSAKKLLYNFSPSSVKGFEENTMFSRDAGNGNKLFINPNTEQGQAIRTPSEQAVRDAAFHPFQESRDRDALIAEKQISGDYASLRERDITRYEHQLAQGTATQSDRDRFATDWAQHRGDQAAAAQIVNYLRNQRLTDVQREQLAAAQGNVASKYGLQDIFKMQGK